MNSLPACLIMAAGTDPVSWQQAEAERDRLRHLAPSQSILLRDYSELDSALAFLEEVVDPIFREGNRLMLRTSYFLIEHYFKIKHIVLVPPVPPAVEAFLRPIPNFEIALLPPPSSVSREEKTTPFVLVLNNETTPHTTKTSETIVRACRENKLRARLQDTSALRLISLIEESQVEPGAWSRLRQRTRDHYDQLLQQESSQGGATVLALDLHWFLDESLFLDDPKVERVISIWFDDPKAWCQANQNTCFPGTIEQLQERMRHPKVLHCCYGKGQMEEMRHLGFSNVRLSFLAASRDYLRHRAAPTITDRVAFIGNPGIRIPPPPSILALLERGAELKEIREQARKEIIPQALHYFAQLPQQEPTLGPWLALALAIRAVEPYTPATTILVRAGHDYPRALEFMNQSGRILDAAFFIKMANQFDRPALVHRIYRAGLIDVYSAVNEWAPYGITALADIPFHSLPEFYQRYACHVNGYNAMRDATANEKLFEIAACARVSINLDSPDVRACYEEGEVALVSSLTEAEERVRHFIAHPEEALAYGERARKRTGLEHLWHHRMHQLFHPHA